MKEEAMNQEKVEKEILKGMIIMIEKIEIEDQMTDMTGMD